MTRHFAVDLGAESGRCIVGSLENGIIQMEELCRFPTQVCRIRGEYYWNIFRYFDEIIKGLRLYAAKYGPKLDSIGVDSWGVDYCLTDHGGDFLGLPRSYRRMTSKEPYSVMESKFGKARLYRHTGIQFLDFNTLNQIIYEQTRNPNYLDQVNHMMFIGDALHYLLGAKPCCEYSAASISQLVDTRTRKWDDEIFQSFSIPRRMQSPIVFAGDDIGVLSDDIAKDTGLNTGVRIIAPAVHDTASASVAVPAKGDDWALISSGTWSLASVELENPINNEDSYRLNLSNSAGVLGRSLLLKNIMGLWIIQQCKYQWQQHSPDLSYSEIVALARKARPFAAFLDPDDARFFTPGNMPQRVADYLHESGQAAVSPDDIGAVARLVYESLALKYRFVLESIRKISGKRISALHITGGGSNNAMLNQFTANAMRVPVIAGPAECSAMGNLLMQAYGCRALGSLAQIRKVVKASAKLLVYLPQEEEIWETAYQNFTNLISCSER